MSEPRDRRNILVPALLAVAGVALVVPWDGVAARAVALGSVLAALAMTCWPEARAVAAAAPRESPEPLDLAALLTRLDRIATAWESRPDIPTRAPDAFATMAAAIAEGRWADAEAILAAHPDHPDATRYLGQIASAKRAAGQAMAEELKAAQGANDPDRVLEIHTRLAAVLTAEAGAEIEAGVVKWFLALIMRRLRGGTVRPDVAELAAKVADRFPRTVEGASLRASLATLRRSAGLCPRCARPYRGIANACPLCLVPAQAAGVDAAPPDAAWSTVPPDDHEPPPQPSSNRLDYPVFLDDPT